MACEDGYLAGERARDPVASFAAASLEFAVLIIAAALLLYPLVPGHHFLAKGPWGSYVFLDQRSGPVPLHLLWGLEGFRNLDAGTRGLLALALVYFGCGRLPKIAGAGLFARIRINKWALLAGVAALTPIFCYVVRVDFAKNVAFADGVWLPPVVDAEDVASAEVLTSYVYFFIRRVVDLFRPGPNGLAAVVYTSCLCGGVFAAATYLFADGLGRDRAEKVILFLGAALAGYAIMFLGYVETTQVELATMALFFAAAAKALQPGAAGPKLWRTALAISAASLVFMSHGAGVLILPAFIYFLATAGRGAERDRGGPLYRAFPALVALFSLLLVAAPYYILVAKPFYLQGDFGNVGGGGDGIMLVPWKVVRGLPKSRLVYYSMLSRHHLAEIFSAFLVAAPLSVPFIASGTAFIFKRGRRFNAYEKQVLRVLALASASCLAVPLLWNHDYGMWGDWNLAACFLYPLNLFSWCLLVVATRGVFSDGTSRFYFMLSLVAAQLVMAFGMLFQLY
jgi:hypothetical protein